MPLVPLNDPDPPGGLVTRAFAAQNALAQGLVDTRLKEIEEQYSAPKAQAAINYQNALTKASQIASQYAPQKNLADIAFTQAQTGAIPSEIQERMARTSSIPIENALHQAQLQNIRRQFEIEQKYPLIGASGISGQLGEYQRLRDMGAPQDIQNMLLENIKSQTEAQKALSAYREMGGGRGTMGVGQKELFGLKQQIKFEHPEWDGRKIDEAASAYISGDDSLPNGESLPSASGQVMATLDQIAKRRSTSQVLNQQRYAATLDSMLKEGDKYIPSVVKYTSLLGKVKGSLDRVKVSLGIDSPDYGNYLYFTRQLVPQSAGEMGRTLGKQATDRANISMEEVLNPVSWDSNPKIAMQNWKRLQNLYSNVINPVISKSTSQIQSGLKTGHEEVNTVTVKSPDGRVGTIPASNLKKALDKGYTQVA